MQIKSLEGMESIVENNKSLNWDGWTVVESKKDALGYMKSNGAFINSAWYVQKRYEPTENGWNIPNKLVR
jgi:predicted FMN-binding regulatory protein PaiB